MSISTIYRDRLRSSLLLGRHTLEIDLRDLLLYNEELGQTVQERPGEVVPLLESATTRLARQILNPLNAQGSLTAAGESSTGGGGAAGGSDAFFTGAHDAIGNAFDDHLPEVQVTLRSGMNMLHFRELTVGLDYLFFSFSAGFARSCASRLTNLHLLSSRGSVFQANTLTKLVRLPGIVINASSLSSRATVLKIQCKGCRSVKTTNQPAGMGGEGKGLPRKCDS